MSRFRLVFMNRSLRLKYEKQHKLASPDLLSSHSTDACLLHVLPGEPFQAMTAVVHGEDMHSYPFDRVSEMRDVHNTYHCFGIRIWLVRGKHHSEQDLLSFVYHFVRCMWHHLCCFHLLAYDFCSIRHPDLYFASGRECGVQSGQFVCF